MKVLSITTASNVCAVAILEDTNLIKELSIADERTHSQKLMPMIAQLFEKTHLTVHDMDLFCCCIGPGSFTGIRIGISTIKAFVDIDTKPTIGVNTLEVLANSIHTEGLICSVIDAKNSNLYLGLYNNNKGTCSALQPEQFYSVEETVSLLQQFTQPITFVGDISILEDYKENFSTSSFMAQQENAYLVGKVGLQKWQNKSVNSSSLSPLYLRKSQAEIAKEGKK